MNAAKAFQEEVGKHSDQPLLSGQSEARIRISSLKSSRHSRSLAMWPSAGIMIDAPPTSSIG